MTSFYPIRKAVTTQAGIKMARSYRNVRLRTITLHKEGVIIKNVEKIEFTVIFTTVVTSSCSETNESSLRHPILRFNINFNIMITSTQLIFFPWGFI